MKTYFGFVILNQYPDVNFDVIVVIVSGCVCGLLIRLLWLLSALAEDKPQPPAQNNLSPSPQRLVPALENAGFFLGKDV